jgi:two-component system, OmpR family, sensor kinase
MNPTPRRKYIQVSLIILSPVLGGLALDILLHLLPTNLPIFRLEADVGNALILLGCLASLFCLVSFLSYRASEKRLQGALADVQQAQDESRRRFYRRLDHEVKNPLTAMRAALASYPEDKSNPTQRQIFTDIQRQVDRLSRLVSDLRKLAELEERPLEKLPVNLEELLEEVVQTVQSSPGYHNRTIHLVLPKVPWPISPIVGDRDLLGLAFYNLADNALKFTSPDKSIEIRAMEDGHSLLVEVADTGPGIPAEDLPRIFEELYRGRNAHSYEGSGLGLALVQRVISRHGGTVSVRSRPGMGSIFTVRLPF